MPHDWHTGDIIASRQHQQRRTKLALFTCLHFLGSNDDAWCVCAHARHRCNCSHTAAAQMCCSYVHIHSCSIHGSIHVYSCTRSHVYTLTRTHSCMYMYTHTYSCTHACLCAFIPVRLQLIAAYHPCACPFDDSTSYVHVLTLSPVVSVLLSVRPSPSRIMATLSSMYLYNLTLQRATAITCAVFGNFSKPKAQVWNMHCA